MGALFSFTWAFGKQIVLHRVKMILIQPEANTASNYPSNFFKTEFHYLKAQYPKKWKKPKLVSMYFR